MKTAVIINGAKGEMGSMACQTIASHPDFEVVAELGRQDNLVSVIKEKNAKIVIDLTNAGCAYENTLTIINNNAHPVIGTTGMSSEEINKLQQISLEKQLGGIIAPNFSIGAILMMRFAEQASRYFPEAEIIETHHQQKLDAPSGTALKTAEMMAKARVKAKNNLPIKEILDHPRGAEYKNINIHAIRLPGFVANQQVIFGSTGESLSIAHNCIDRSSFMPGIVLACQSVLNLKSLCYGLENILDP